MSSRSGWSERMLFILSDDANHDDQRRAGFVRRMKSWEPIGDLDRSCFTAWRAFDEVEIPAAELCISFQEEADFSEVEGVPRIWSLPSSF